MEPTNRPGVADSPPPENQKESTATVEPPPVSVRDQRQRRREEARRERVRKHLNHDRTMAEFQPDAVEIETTSVPGGARWTLYTVIAFMLAAVAWAYFSKVDRIVSAQGQLITVEPAVVIDTSVTASVRSMLAEFGDTVMAGDLLATLDPTYSEADLVQLNSKVAGLTALTDRLAAEREGRKFDVDPDAADPPLLMQYRVFLERQNEYQAKLREFDAQKTKLTVQKQANLVAIDQNREAYRDYREYQKTIEILVERGSKSEEDRLSRRLQTSQAKMTYYETVNRDKELDAEIAAALTQREAFIAGWKAKTVSELVEATQEKTATQQELAKAIRTNEQVELRVPNDEPGKEFFVFEVSDVTVGSVSRPGEPLYRLIPLDVPYEAEVEISGRDIAMINESDAIPDIAEALPPGSEVRVKLDSFPYQKHGTISGQIRKISEGSFEKQGPGGQPSGVTMYKARVRLLNPDALENVSKNFRLMPGMTVTAEIKVGNRRVIEYFLYPLLRYLDQAVREP